MAMLKSYISKATYEWIIDHSFTPYILVDSEYDGVSVPKDSIDDDGKILLDLSTNAIQNLFFSDTRITFDATFAGDFMNIVIPIESVLEIFANETEQGMYAREFGYGLNINEGDSEEMLNPAKNTSKSREDNITTIDNITTL